MIKWRCFTIVNEVLTHCIGVIFVTIGFALVLYTLTAIGVMHIFEVNLLEGGYEALSATIAIIALFIAIVVAFSSVASKSRDAVDRQKHHEEILAEMRQGREDARKRDEEFKQIFMLLQQSLRPATRINSRNGREARATAKEPQVNEIPKTNKETE